MQYLLQIFFSILTTIAVGAQKYNPQNDIAKANQILNFTINKKLNKPVLIINEEKIYFTLYGIEGIGFDENKEMETKYYTEKHLLTTSNGKEVQRDYLQFNFNPMKIKSGILKKPKSVKLLI